VEWIHLAQDRDCWQALVIAVMNLQVLAPRNSLVLLGHIMNIINLIISCLLKD
jgi:hypothetical protein